MGFVIHWHESAMSPTLKMFSLFQSLIHFCTNHFSFMQQLTDNNVNELFHVSMFFFYNSTKMCYGYNLHFRIYLCPSMLILVVQFSWVVSDYLWPHELQHTRPPCPSPTPRAHPNPCPLSQWCHPIISSSVIPFSHPQSFPAWGSFQMSQLFASGGWGIGVSASTSVLPMNTQELSPCC